MQEHNERMEPEMQESESGALIVLNVLLKIEGIEMQLRGQLWYISVKLLSINASCSMTSGVT